jgi:hypothetical protein
MLRKIAVSSALILLAEVAVVTLLPDASGAVISEAQAADFTGRIKRIKIKKKRVGSGFKMVVVTESDDADAIASADVTLCDPVTGEVLETLTLDEPGRARVISLDDDAAVTGGDTLHVTFKAQSIDHNGDPFGEQQEFEVSIDMLEARTAEGDPGDGWKVRVRNTGAGLQVVVLNEDRSWSGGGVSDVGYSVNDGTDVLTADLDEVRQRMSTRITTDLSAYDSVLVDTELYDADGVLLDSSSSTVRTSEATEAPALDQVKVKQANDGDAKVVTWTQSGGLDTSLDVELIDNATGEAALAVLDDTPVRSQRHYYYEGLEFDPGESPGDYVYLVLIDLIGPDGDPVGMQYEVELTVPSLVEGQDYSASYETFADDTGAISFLTDADGVHVHVILENEDVLSVEQVNVIFEEPYEGPAPLETELETPMVVQWDKWVQRGDALPSDYTLTTTLLAEDDTVLETATSTGSGTGIQYATTGNGSGTKIASTQAEQQHFPLL